MKLRKFFYSVLLTIILIVFAVTPVFALGVLPADDPVTIVKDLIVAVSAAVGIGAALSFLLQLGKLFLPKIFADTTLENWRLLFVVITALILYIGPQFGWMITAAGLDVAAQSLAELGALLMPLFIWLADWFAKTFYKNVLRGRALVGKSYSLKL